MRLIHIFAVFILSISCSQKDIVEDYQRRIANTYSYTQNKIGTRASAPFISIEVELYNQCKKKKDQEKSKCLADSYNLIFANPELKSQQIDQLIGFLRTDLKQFRSLMAQFRKKIDHLKLTSPETNKTSFNNLILSLEADHKYYLRAANIFVDYLNNLSSNFSDIQLRAISSLQYIASSDVSLRENMYLELHRKLLPVQNFDKAHPIVQYKQMLQILYGLSTKKTPLNINSKQHTSYAHGPSFNVRDLLAKTPVIQSNMGKQFSTLNYREIIKGVWSSVHQVLIQNKAFTHINIAKSFYDGRKHRLVHYIPISSNCDILKKNSFYELNIPWQSNYINLFFSQKGALKNGINCRRFQLKNNMTDEEYGSHIGVKLNIPRKELKVIYEQNGELNGAFTFTTKLFSPTPKVIAGEITKALSL